MLLSEDEFALEGPAAASVVPMLVHRLLIANVKTILIGLTNLTVSAKSTEVTKSAVISSITVVTVTTVIPTAAASAAKVVHSLSLTGLEALLIRLPDRSVGHAAVAAPILVVAVAVSVTITLVIYTTVVAIIAIAALRTDARARHQ